MNARINQNLQDQRNHDVKSDKIKIDWILYCEKLNEVRL